MGAEGPRSFSAIIAAKSAEFISYREAISKLAESTGDSLEHVAVVLKQRGTHTRNGAYLAGPEQEVLEAQSPYSLGALLDETIRTGQIVAVQFEPDAETANPDRNGWMRFQFAADLTTSELPCPSTLKTPGVASVAATAPSTEEKSPPDWMTDMRAMASFTPWEAACVLTEIDPYEPDWGDGGYARDPGAQAEIQRYTRLLVTAIVAKELPANPSGSDPKTQEIPHASIRAWCRKYAYKWPIPDPDPLPTTDVDLAERLRVAEAECDRLRREVAALSNVARNRDGLQSVEVPHVTHGMNCLFEVMREHWATYNKDAPPKSIVVARAIDDALGYRKAKDGSPSRNGQALAALIRPDELGKHTGA